MIKIAIYVDGPSVPARTNDIRMAMLYETTKTTPGDILDDGTVILTFHSIDTTGITASGSPVTPKVFLNNLNKFTYVNSLAFKGGNLDDNKLASLDDAIPLTFDRANTVVSLGRL